MNSSVGIWRSLAAPADKQLPFGTLYGLAFAAQQIMDASPAV